LAAYFHWFGAVLCCALTILTPRSLIARNPGYEVPAGWSLGGSTLPVFCR